MVTSTAVNALARRLQHSFADIAREDLDIPFGQGRMFHGHNRQRVGLITGRAAGAPKPYRIGRLVSLHHIRNDGIDERLEVRLIPVEVGLAGRNEVIEGGQLLIAPRVKLEEIVVFLV